MALIYSTGEIVKIHFWHRDGIAYVTPMGIRLAYHGEYEEMEN